MNPNNPVIKLCLRGIQVEAAGRFEDARDLFMQAWMERKDDFDACVAAHYVARHQEEPEDTLQKGIANVESGSPRTAGKARRTDA